MKRKIASAMCLVMMGVNLAAPVYAATTATGSGSGSTTYVSTEHYEVIVPTSAALNFKLDPQGLLALKTGDKKSVDSLNTSSAAGAIFGRNALVFANLGTDDVSVSARFAVTGDATAVASSGTVVAEPTSTAPGYNVKLALVPYAAEKDTTVTYKMGNSTANANLFKATTTAFKSNDADKEVKGVAFDNTNSTFTFKLAAPSWDIEKLGEDSYSLVMDQDTNDKAVAFKIGGECNSKADWFDFTKASGTTGAKSIGLTATFTLDKAADNFTPNVTLDLDNKTVAANTGANLIKVPVENTAPATPTAIESSNITVSGKEITIGGFTGTASVTSVKIGDTTAEATDYTAVTTTANSLKVTLANDAGDDRTVVVTFKVGNAEYTATTKVDGLNVLESNGSVDIVIYDDAIKSTDTITITPIEITGTNKAAMTKTVSANPTHISIVNGVLTIKKACVTALIEASTRGKGTYKVTASSSEGEYTITIK